MRAATCGAGAVLATLAALLGGCAVLSATPPTVAVAAIRLTDLGLVDEGFALTLCVTNPNQTDLDFSRVRFRVVVADARLAEGENVAAITLRPQSSTLVPIAVGTTIRNLGPQIMATIAAGAVVYSVHGTVDFAGFPIGIPFSKAGRLSLASIGLALAASDDATASTPCQAQSPGPPA